MKQRAHRNRAIVLALVISGLAAMAHAGEFKFKGREVTDKKTGLTLLPVKEVNGVAVSSLLHHYFVVLPYAREWRFESSKDTPLKGSDGKYEVTIMTKDGQAESPTVQLQDLLAKLRQLPGLQILEPQVFEEKGQAILRYQAQLALGISLPDDKQWNYWTVAVHDGRSITLHLSTLDESVGTGSEDQRIRTLMSSLRADFKR